MFKTYEEAYDDAVIKARQMKMDVGLEYNSIFKEYRVFLLPPPNSRFGHELRCEVVTPTSPRIVRGNT